MGGVRYGQPSGKFLFQSGKLLNPTENNLLAPSNFEKKKHCLCIFEGHLTTNPILSVFHLQGLKSNIYICIFTS